MNDIPPKNSKNILADCFLIGGLTIASIAIAFWITQEGEGRGPSNAPNHRSISEARPLAASSLSGELDFYLMDFLQKPFNSEICSLEKYFKDMPVGKGLSLQPFSPEEAHGFMYTHREAFHRCEIRFKSMHLVKQTNKEAQPPAKNKGVPNLHRQNDNKSSSLLASCFTVSGENHAKALLELTLQIRDTKTQKPIQCANLIAMNSNRNLSEKKLGVILYYTLYWNESQLLSETKNPKQATGGIEATMPLEETNISHLRSSQTQQQDALMHNDVF